MATRSAGHGGMASQRATVVPSGEAYLRGGAASRGGVACRAGGRRAPVGHHLEGALERLVHHRGARPLVHGRKVDEHADDVRAERVAQEAQQRAQRCAVWVGMHARAPRMREEADGAVAGLQCGRCLLRRQKVAVRLVLLIGALEILPPPDERQSAVAHVPGVQQPDGAGRELGRQRVIERQERVGRPATRAFPRPPFDLLASWSCRRGAAAHLDEMARVDVSRRVARFPAHTVSPAWPPQNVLRELARQLRLADSR